MPLFPIKRVVCHYLIVRKQFLSITRTCLCQKYFNGEAESLSHQCHRATKKCFFKNLFHYTVLSFDVYRL